MAVDSLRRYYTKEQAKVNLGCCQTTKDQEKSRLLFLLTGDLLTEVDESDTTIDTKDDLV